MGPVMQKHVKQLMTRDQKALHALNDLYEELEHIHDAEAPNGMNLSSIALRSCLKNAYSFEYALQQYANKECWMDSATLRECVQGWYIRIHGFRIRPQHGCVESTLSLLRKYGYRYITISMIRYLLLKECTLPDDVKQLFYTDLSKPHGLETQV